MHTKSPSRKQGMFGLLFRAYRFFSSKKHSLSNKHNSMPDHETTDAVKSFDQTCKELNDNSEVRRATNEMIHGLRSDEANVHPHDGNPNSPNHNSNNQNKSTPSFFSRSLSVTRDSRKPGLFRSASQTPTESNNLTRSFTGQSVEPNNVGVLKKSSSSISPESTSQGLRGSMAQSGPLFRSASRKGPDFVYSNLNVLLRLLTMEQSLECTLEDLCFGCVKMITIARKAISGNGKVVNEMETLFIKVKPGWKKGTTITFEGMKDEEKGTYTSDVNFVIAETKHKLYRREGDDLELAVRTSLVQALTGCTLQIPLLGGEEMSLTLYEIIEPGCETIIAGQGMPKFKEQRQRGNLKVTFLVDFPTELTEDRKSEIATILRDSF